MGSLLFCLVIHQIVEKLQSELKIFHLDDGLLGESAAEVLDDIQLIQKDAAQLGLQLNLNKSELICQNPLDSSLLLSAPELIPTEPHLALFLGSPIGGRNSVDSAISMKCDTLKIMGERLPHFQKHDSLLLLRHSFSIPKILHLLRTSPCFHSAELANFDILLCSITSSVLNVN